MKPDRFTKMASKEFKDCDCAHCSQSRDIAKTLLRRQFAQVRRVVVTLRRRNEQSDACMEAEEIQQYSQACDHMLAALDKYKLGTK